MDAKLKQLMKQLGDTINTSLSESEDIADVITSIREQGYDVFLMLEATIGFNKHEDEEEEETAVVMSSTTSDGEPELHISPQDAKFLRSLRITLDDDSPDIRHNA